MKTTNTLGLLLLLFCGCSAIKASKSNSFTKDQISLINASDSLTSMRVFKITSKTDSLLLRTKSDYIKADPKDKLLQKFVNRLYKTVRDSSSLGVGIAAPQVGILKNIIWVQRFDKEDFPFEVYLNPIISEYSEEKQTYKEGCLSIPNRSDIVNSRALFISISYDTMQGEHLSETVDGFTAVIFQHEIDHLNGILYLDHLEKEINDATK
ncbi:peptide deformylase [Mariniflexile aquimaris]|uniref:Peptide deformylase n=1 Tax=Mariniflexile aquimaris TaxID=881009 RepID=A0ABW3BQD5_9FLAO